MTALHLRWNALLLWWARFNLNLAEGRAALLSEDIHDLKNEVIARQWTVDRLEMKRIAQEKPV